jgi:hypothetical protein
MAFLFGSVSWVLGQFGFLVSFRVVSWLLIEDLKS